ncbi:hypothetical protein V1264_016925 [Littorina saxatilis]|uniref:Uncharacterized protein n=1 Tax=Littorina saxatilis TaxID=31220 RepID=A0AAN9BI25_9CAEN
MLGGLRRLPLPPVPHHARRQAAGPGVVFHVPPVGHNDCVQGHFYDEIPEDSHQSISENSPASVRSSPVSDSSMSDDCLHHIACPSSDSSLPEDYLNPVASAWEFVATIKEEDLTSSSSSEAVMYAEERITFKKKTTAKVTTSPV